MSKDKEPGKGWFDKAVTAEIFGCEERYVDGHHRKIAPDAVKTVGRKVYLHLPTVIKAHVADKLAKADKSSTQVEDPLLVGSDSPQLERYRAAKAGLAELDLEQRKKTHVDAHELHDGFMAIAGIVRRSAGDTLLARFGNDATEILNDAIEEAIRQFLTLVPKPNDGVSELPG